MAAIHSMDTRQGTAAHQKLVDDLLYVFGSRPDVRVWIRVVGFDEKRKIKYGIKGETDIQGIVGPKGRSLFIEAKTGNAKLNEDQVRFRAMVIKFGGIYILAREVKQALADFEFQL